MTAEKGFTLVEALVVLTLLGIGILFFLKNSFLAMGFHERGRKMSEALRLAQARLELLEARGWRGAVEDCVADGALRYGKEVVLRGKTYRLLLERRSVSTSLDYYTVTCFWEGPSGDFSRESSVSLSTARGRRR
jgi:prepilin-type N-terminal cleavage/methylation domain-containing protein